MLKLMELGWEKYHLSKYIMGIIIYIMSNFFHVSLVQWGFKGEGELLFSEYIGLMFLLNILIKTTLIIILAVILLRLIIDEYKNHYRISIFNIMSIVYIIMQ
ncbi:hypothetical protein [Lysinibacillus sp. NPDC093688]|uniref:hypothetical protein n=1 Tax=Lysinibacillus sp. NPDC093688 TaxID=3390577 RepID=UPI003CFD3112